MNGAARAVAIALLGLTVSSHALEGSRACDATFSWAAKICDAVEVMQTRYRGRNYQELIGFTELPPEQVVGGFTAVVRAFGGRAISRKDHEARVQLVATIEGVPCRLLLLAQERGQSLHLQYELPGGSQPPGRILFDRFPEFDQLEWRVTFRKEYFSGDEARGHIIYVSSVGITRARDAMIHFLDANGWKSPQEGRRGTSYLKGKHVLRFQIAELGDGKGAAISVELAAGGSDD